MEVQPREERRRSQRVLLVVPVQVVWKSDDGVEVKENAETEVVSAHGALLRMKAPITLAREVQIIRASQRLSASARVVGMYPARADGLVRVAVELGVPSETFWGVTIPRVTQKP